jgi:putative NADH-flavin reductase
VVSKQMIVFGATGKTGRLFVSQALTAGHRVTAVARDPAKLDIQHPRLTVLRGDMLDAESIDAVMAGGADVVVSALGLFHRQPDTRLSEGTQRIISAMQRHGLRRLVVLTSLGAGDSRGQGNWWARAVQRLLLRHVLDDKDRQEAAIRDSGLAWTVIRPPQLTDDMRVREDLVAWTGDQPRQRVTWKIGRATLARFMLQVVESGAWVEDAINVSDPA